MPAEREDGRLLSAVTSYGQLGRMTQFKDKADRREFVSARVYRIPGADGRRHPPLPDARVPIGDDQRQHLELARDVAERFNARFGETFVVPEGVYPEIGARVPWTSREPTRKMSTTGGTAQGTVKLLDEPDAIRKKFRSAVTDSGREIRRGDDKPGVSNLIDILAVATQRTPGEIGVTVPRLRLRRTWPQARHQRGGRRAARPGARALPRASRRPAGAPAPARDRG